MSNDLQSADQGWHGFLKRITMNSTDRANSMSRGVNEYLPAEMESFFDPSGGVYNAIVSGGDYNLRNSAIVAQAVCAAANRFPVIVLHEGNAMLADQLKGRFQAAGKYLEVSPRNPCFEPFYGLNELEIANQILETAPKTYNIQYNARYYIEGVSQLLSKSGKLISFKMLSTCPHAQIFDKVDDLYNQGLINDSEEQEIKSKLMMGQSENFKLDSFLAGLRMEMGASLYMFQRGIPPVNVLSAVKSGSVLSLDISSVGNKMFLDTIVWQLKLASMKGLGYVLITDSIPLNTTENYSTYMKTPSGRFSRTIVSDDVYAMTGSDEKAFSALVGDSQISVIMGHTAGTSAAKWAEVIGQYDKFEKSYSQSRGGSKNTPFSIFASPNYQNSVSINKTREYVVKPEEITHLGRGEAYILSAARGELAHIVLTG